MNQGFLFILLSLCMGFAQAQTNTIQTHTQEPTMPPAQQTLEEFNQPDVFMQSMTRLDVNAFKKHQSFEWSFIAPDGRHIRQLHSGDGYQEVISRPDSPYEFLNTYDANGHLSGKAVRFYGNFVGEALDFSPQGNIIKRINFDGPFKFTIDQLHAMMLKDYHVNIMETTRTDALGKVRLVLRSVYPPENRPYYEIFVISPTYSGDLTTYLVDGVTGQMLYQGKATQNPDSMGPSPYVGYMQIQGKPLPFEP